jgi:hypothetical protein
MREVHYFGAWCHGALSALHALALVYNLRRKNWGDAAIHTAFLVYDVRAAKHHMEEAR